MIKSQNVPYVKNYDENGELTNPIKGVYASGKYLTRKERSEHMQKKRFYGESNNFHLTVSGSSKFLRFKQIEFAKNGKRKVIEHYIER